MSSCQVPDTVARIVEEVRTAGESAGDDAKAAKVARQRRAADPLVVARIAAIHEGSPDGLLLRQELAGLGVSAGALKASLKWHRDAQKSAEPKAARTQQDFGEDEDQELQDEDAAGPGAPQPVDADWQSRLVRCEGKNSGGALVQHPANVTTILKNDINWRGVLAWDRFRQQIVFRRPPRWGSDEAIVETKVDDSSEALGDTGQTRLAAWLLRSRYRLNVTEKQVYLGAMVAAEGNAFDQLTEYLDGLEHDGVPRIENWLATYLGALSSAYTRFVGKAFLVSAIARAYVAGEQVDHMLVLEGAQDRGKSSALKVLFGDFYSGTPLDLGSKDRFLGLRGKWCQSFDELASLARSDINVVKNFLTEREDHYRAPYGTVSRTVKRRIVFAGTLNPENGIGYLKDPTGNRRFWPVLCAKVGPIDLAALRRDRDQIWAEARDAYRAGAKWHPVTDEEKALCRGEQEKREEGSPWDALIAAWLSGEEQECPRCKGKADDCYTCKNKGTVAGRDTTVPYVTQAQILETVLGIPKERWNTYTTKLAAVLTKLGCVSQRLKTDAGKVTAYYPRSADVPDEDVERDAIANPPP